MTIDFPLYETKTETPKESFTRTDCKFIKWKILLLVSKSFYILEIPDEFLTSMFSHTEFCFNIFGFREEILFFIAVLWINLSTENWQCGSSRVEICVQNHKGRYREHIFDLWITLLSPDFDFSVILIIDDKDIVISLCYYYFYLRFKKINLKNSKIIKKYIINFSWKKREIGNT